jgi:hypothetical protein
MRQFDTQAIEHKSTDQTDQCTPAPVIQENILNMTYYTNMKNYFGAQGTSITSQQILPIPGQLSLT